MSKQDRFGTLQFDLTHDFEAGIVAHYAGAVCLLCRRRHLIARLEIYS